MAARHAGRRVPEPVRGADAARLRGLGGDVPLLRAVRRGRREADEGRFWFWNSMHFPVPMPAFDVICIDSPYQAVGAVAEPRVRGAAGDGHRLPLRQRLHLHLRQPGHRPRRRWPSAPSSSSSAPATTSQNWDELYAQVAGQDGGADRRDRRAAGARAARVRARRGRVRRRATRASTSVLDAYDRALRLGDLMWQHHFEFLLLGYGAYATFAEFCKAPAARHPRPAHRPDGRGHRRAPVPARRRAAPPGAPGDRDRRRRRVRRGPHAAGDRRRAGRRAKPAAPGWPSWRRSRTRGSTWPPATASTTTTAAGSTTRAIPYASLIGHIAALRAGEEIERPTEEIARRARAAGRGVRRAAGPRGARRRSTSCWRSSRTVFPYVEEHKFYLRLLVPDPLVEQDPRVRRAARRARVPGGRRGRLPALAPRGRTRRWTSCR